MKVLVIPDVHLKPYMFRKADILMEIMTLAIFGNVWRRDLAVWLR